MLARSPDNGITWTDPTPLNTNATTDSLWDRSPNVTTDGFGNWMAVWNKGGSIVWTASTDNGETWAEQGPISTNTITGDGRPDVSSDHAGTWVAVWLKEGDNWLCEVRAARAFSGPPVLTVDIDIKPGSCPNPLNTKSKGVLPVAILGTDGFDVTEIDVSTVLLEGVAPVRDSVEDVSEPVMDAQDECEYATEGPDGFDDLTLQYDTQEIVAALGPVNDRNEIVLTLTGELFDGTPIEGQDCIVVISKANNDGNGDE